MQTGDSKEKFADGSINGTICRRASQRNNLQADQSTEQFADGSLHEQVRKNYKKNKSGRGHRPRFGSQRGRIPPVGERVSIPDHRLSRPLIKSAS
jgi:hypothetical protein